MSTGPKPITTATALAAFRDELIEKGVPQEVADQMLIERNRTHHELIVNVPTEEVAR